MKKLLFLIGISMIAATALHAQSVSRSATAPRAAANPRAVEASDIRMSRSGEYVTMSFTFRAGNRATRPDYDLVVSPVIRGAVGERSLNPIIVHGKRAKAFHEESQALWTAPGRSLSYTATLPYESWMRGAELVLEGMSVGCCSSAEVSLGLIAERILDVEPVYETQLIETPVYVTTGEQLAIRYPFIAPAVELEQIRQPQPAFGGRAFDYNEYNYNMSLDLGNGSTAYRSNVQSPQVERIIAETRTGSISIFFPQGGRTIDRYFGNNNRNLVEMISAVRALVASQDSRISKIVVAGFASPEGSPATNDRLAWDRAVAVKEFLTANSNIDPSVVEVFNGSVDWAGLRELVERSDMYRKQQILNIIDRTPIWDASRNRGRLGELMRLDSGEPYRHMASEFFPQLRQAAYIKVYYESK